MKSAVNAAAANPGLLQPAVANGGYQGYQAATGAAQFQQQAVPVAYTTNAPMGQPAAYNVVQYGNGAQYGAQGGQYGVQGGQGGQVYGQNTYQVLHQDHSAQGLNFHQGV